MGRDVRGLVFGEERKRIVSWWCGKSGGGQRVVSGETDFLQPATYTKSSHGSELATSQEANAGA